MALSELGQQLSNGNPEGSSYGQSATDLIGFYGVTPVAQQSGSAQAALATTAAVTTGGYMFATSAQADGAITLLNEIRSCLVDLGLIKGSA